MHEELASRHARVSAQGLDDIATPGHRCLCTRANSDRGETSLEGASRRMAGAQLGRQGGHSFAHDATSTLTNAGGRHARAQSLAELPDDTH